MFIDQQRNKRAVLGRVTAPEEDWGQESDFETQEPSGFHRAANELFSLVSIVDSKQSIFDNTTRPHNKSRSAPAVLNSMDQDRGATRLPPRSPNEPEPLQVRKQSNQLHPARSQQQLPQNNPHQRIYEKPVYPPRKSSMRNRGQSFDTPQGHSTRRVTPLGFDDTAQSSLSDHVGYYLSDTSIEAPSTAGNTVRSTLSSFKSSFLSDASPEIMGDFVPINPVHIAYRPATADGSKVVFHA
jgi:hypothetical protein